MIQRHTLLILPLMHHLMDQRVKHVLPRVPLQMPQRKGYLGTLAATSDHVVPQPVLHPPGNAHSDCAKLPGKQSRIVFRVRQLQPRDDRRITRSLSFRPSLLSRDGDLRSRRRRSRNFRAHRLHLEQITLRPQLPQSLEPQRLSQRSKQRCGPGMNSPSPSHMNVTTVML